MKNTCKILALVLVVMTVIMSLSAITVSAATEGKVYTLNANDLEAVASSADNTRISAGTDNFFTIILKNGGKVDEANYTFSDGSSFTQRINFGGKINVSSGVVNKSAIEFTTTGKAKLKVWWVCGSSTGERYVALFNADAPKTEVSATEKGTAGEAYISEFEIHGAGTWYIAPAGNGSYFCKVELTEIVDCTHVFEHGVCTLCGEADPSVCQHTNTSPATCTAPKKCLDCEAELEAALGHTAGAEPTCVDAQICTVCGEVITKALGHTLTFVNTLPTADAAGSIKAHCSVCEADIDFGVLNAMTPGSYEFDAKALGSVTKGACYDGEVKIVGGVFACHLSATYQNQSGREKNDTFYVDDMPVWTASHRMHFGGQSELLKNEDVHTGGYKNFIQIVTTAETTITIYWGAGKGNREMAVYDMAGKRLYETDENPDSNELSISTLTVPAGAYLIGVYNPEDAESAGGNYLHRITFDVKAPHTHSFSDATCTEAPKCECGATEGEALGHDYKDGKCTRCEAADPDYVAPPVEEPKDEPKEEPKEMNFFQKIIAWIVSLFKSIFGVFKK